MTACFIGFGEVGRIYARAFSDAGIAVDFVCDAYFSEASAALAAEVGAVVQEAVGPWLQDCDLIMSAVTGGAALDVLRSALPHMKQGALFVDMTTASPEAMQQAGKLAAQNGQSFVDVGILGAVSIKKGATALVLAGDGADVFARIAERMGAKSKILAGEPGDAVRLKLLRSVFTKGLEALAVETLVAAEMQNLRGEFYDIISDIDETPLRHFLEVLVSTHVVHSARRAHEVHEASVQLEKLGISPLVTGGVEALFRRTVQKSNKPTEPPAIEMALSWLSQGSTHNTEKATA